MNDIDRKWKYEKGVVFWDGWRNIEEEPYTGDCDDFTWTKLVYLKGGVGGALWALLTLQAVIWHVSSQANMKSGGLKALFGAHSVLWVKNLGYTDSTFREWRMYMSPHSYRWPQLFIPWVLLRILMGAVWKWTYTIKQLGLRTDHEGYARN